MNSKDSNRKNNEHKRRLFNWVVEFKKKKELKETTSSSNESKRNDVCDSGKLDKDKIDEDEILCIIQFLLYIVYLFLNIYYINRFTCIFITLYQYSCICNLTCTKKNIQFMSLLYNFISFIHLFTFV